MLRDGFLRFCNDPEIACCKAERELEQLRAENASLREQLAESQRREKAAVADLEACMHYASPKNNNTCNFCANDLAEYPEKCIGREDFVTCCPKWRGPQEAGKAGDAKG